MFVLYFPAILNILHRPLSFLPTFKFYKEWINLHPSIFYVNHISLSTAKTKAVSEYNQSRAFCIIKERQCAAWPQKPYKINESQSLLDLSSLELGIFILIRTLLCRRVITEQRLLKNAKLHGHVNLYAISLLPPWLNCDPGTRLFTIGVYIAVICLSFHILNINSR